MVRKVKYPVKAALARFLPIKNHLNNMRDYLSQTGHPEFEARILDIRRHCDFLQRDLRLFREKRIRGR